MEEKQFDPNNPYDTTIRQITAMFEGHSLEFADNVWRQVQERLRRNFTLQSKPTS